MEITDDIDGLYFQYYMGDQNFSPTAIWNGREVMVQGDPTACSTSFFKETVLAGQFCSRGSAALCKITIPEQDDPREPSQGDLDYSVDLNVTPDFSASVNVNTEACTPDQDQKFDLDVSFDTHGSGSVGSAYSQTIDGDKEISGEIEADTEGNVSGQVSFDIEF